MTTVGTGKMVGAQVKRVEDPRVLLGQSQYVDDIHLPGTLGVAFVRNPYPQRPDTHDRCQRRSSVSRG